MMRDGQGGERDFDGALKQFRAAAEDDDADALVDLAAAYANGEGVERDLVEAYEWLLTADRWAGSGNFAKALRSYKTTVARKLKAHDIKQATRRANAWLSEHPVEVMSFPPARFGPEFDPAVPCSRPRFPEGAKARGEKGKVEVLIKVDAQGRVAGATLVASSGFAALDQATMSGVQSCRFTPALRFGKPVEGEKSVSIVW